MKTFAVICKKTNQILAIWEAFTLEIAENWAFNDFGKNVKVVDFDAIAHSFE